MPLHLPWIDAINTLKRERGAVIMAHSYQSPEIFHGVADITGDSLALAQAAADCDSELIVLCGVHFMAETAKILAPDKTVLIPDLEAGCSLASSITAADVRALRAHHPGVPVVSYVNTSAAVKAESDACCTSANAVQVVEAMGADKVIFLPDRFLGALGRDARPRSSWCCGTAAARCTSSSPRSRRGMRANASTRCWWRIRNARRKCSPKPISSARPARWAAGWRRRSPNAWR